MTNLLCTYCGEDLPYTDEDRHATPLLIDILLDKHLSACEAFTGSGGGTYRCSFCRSVVDLSQRVALSLFSCTPDEAVEALKAEHLAHLAVCDAYVGRSVENGMAAIESTLKEAAR